MNHSTSLARRAALLAVVITLALLIVLLWSIALALRDVVTVDLAGLLLLGLPRIIFAHRRLMLLQTRKHSHVNAPAQFLIHWLVLCSALRTALVSSSVTRPI